MASGAAEAVSLEAMRYSRVAMWFHWIIAALIIANLFVGIVHEDASKAIRGPMMSFHKATGILILFLSLARLAWRVGHRPPTFDPVLKPWEMALARTTHWAFYALMIILPLSGWLMVSGSPRPTTFYGMFVIPSLPVSKSSHEVFEQAHGILGYGLLVLVLLHVAGAAKHHLQGHRQLIGRMGPWLYRG